MKHSWREWFPWPVGTHWCAYETGLAIIVGTTFAAMLLLVVVATLMRMIP